MAAMTQEQLTKHITDVVAPLITATVGKQVADIVEAKVKSAVESTTTAPPWIATLMDRSREGSEHANAPVKREVGQAFGRIVRAIANSKREGTGAQGVADTLKAWGDTDLSDKVIAQKALSATSATGGGFLVPEEFSTDIIVLRRAATVVRQLGPREMPMGNGTINIPKLTAAASGGYIGENANLTKSEQTFGNVTMTFKKLGVLVPISNDLIRFSSPQADGLVRDDVVRGLSVTEDQAFIRGDGTNGTPKGLRYWVPAANLIQANGTVNLANVATDLGNAMLALMAQNVPFVRPGWIFAPRTWKYLTTVQNSNGFYVFRDEMMTGKLWGFPFKVTTSVPIVLTNGSGTNGNGSEVYFVNFDDMAIGDSQRLMIDVSTEAAYYNGSTVVAAFSQDQTVIRAIAEHDFAARDANAIAVINGVSWGV